MPKWCGKKPYLTPEEAHKKLPELIAKYKTPMGVYKCEDCSLTVYHHFSFSKRKRRGNPERQWFRREKRYYERRVLPIQEWENEGGAIREYGTYKS